MAAPLLLAVIVVANLLSAATAAPKADSHNSV